MTEQHTVPNCPYCGSEQIINTENVQGIYVSAVCCTNGGCASCGPLRESEKKELAEELALEAYMRAWETMDKLVRFAQRTIDLVDDYTIVDLRPDEIGEIRQVLKLDLDRRAGVGHNYRAPGGAKSR